MKFFAALAILSILGLSAISRADGPVIYQNFADAWAVCTNGDVSAYWSNGQMLGWICTPNNHGQAQ